MYNYQAEKHKIFTPEGQVIFLAIRDKTKDLIKKAGAVRMQEAIAGNSGDSWLMIACIDRLVELKELREVTNGDVAGQYRIFTK